MFSFSKSTSLKDGQTNKRTNGSKNITRFSWQPASNPHSNKLWTASMPPSAATTVPLAVASGGPPTGVAEAPPLDRWRRPGGGKPVTGQHPVYATGPALILVYRFFFTILLSQYCGILLRPFKRVTLRLSNRNLNQYSHCWHWPSPV